MMQLKKIKYRLIFNKYKNSVYNFALSITQSSFDADDISQEIWIKYWENFEEIDYSKSKAWIYRSVHNKCIDLIRQRKNQVRISDEELFAIEDTRVENNPIEIDENRIISEIITKSLSKLPEKQKSIFQMYEIENFKYNEISEMLDLPINSVKVYLMRARQNLQVLLKSEGVV
jgi:RNA polymerase sigma-70 factor (ECF subfamily)